jgi:hypothetical protein
MKRRKGSTRCKVCNHPERHHIDRLIAGQKYADRLIAVKFHLSMSSVRRHRIDHLPKYLAHSAKARELVDKEKILGEIEDMVHDVRMLFDACHEYLLDPEDPSRYFLGPRAHEIEVVYLERVVTNPEKGKERVFKRRAQLDELLARTGVEVDHSKYSIADPRKLILEAAERLEHIIETIADISGFIPKPGYGGPQTQINLQVFYQLMPNVVTALRRHPEAMVDVMAELEKAREAPTPLLEAAPADGP